MKILHSADLHLGTPFRGRTEQQFRQLRRAQLEIPRKLAEICRSRQCDLMLLSGDLLDSAWTKEDFDALRSALEQAAVPVFISPGNHDFCAPNSPYLSEIWPENVHIFTQPIIESHLLEDLNCRIYGAGYRSMDCSSLLEDFRAAEDAQYHIAVLHADPTQVSSPYSPITRDQVRQSGLDYLALGHIHKSGSFREGDTLCAWPGCPMGRGFDELGEKGVLIVTLDHTATAQFVPLDTPRFYDSQVPAAPDPEQAIRSRLPAVGNEDHYRVTLTGPSPALDPEALAARFPDFPNLILRDQTVPETDLWGTAGEDTLEGIYFRLLREASEKAGEEEKAMLCLAARISRQLLDGQEVTL